MRMTIKLKTLIERIFAKKNIKIFLSLFIVVWFFVWTSFADSSWTTKNIILERFTYLLNIVISLLSWWWIVLASLAWKLMTNELVYWTFLNLDMALWNLWNVIKNFANFILWFLLLFSIVKNIFLVVKSDANPLKNAFDTVKKVLIAWVLVQMSRFLVWVALDLSTVATALVWSLPAQIISSNSSDLQKHLHWMLESKQVKLEVNFDDADIVKSVSTWYVNEDDLRKIIDTITPSANSVIWPLIFLWWSVFDLFNTTDTSYMTSDSLSWRNLFITLGVNWFVIISFTIMMAFIFLFNLFRVITLWIIIPLSPFIILMKVFNSKGDKLKVEWFFWEVLSLKNVFSLIFKPVYMVLVLSIVLIVMTIVKGLVNNNWTFTWDNYWNVSITTNQVGEGDNAVYNSSMNLNWTKNTIVDLMVYILWLILMFMLMKSCITSKTGIWFIDKTMSNISWALWGDKPWEIWWLLWSLWVIPVWAKWERIWLNTMKEFKEKVTGNGNNEWANFAGIDMKKQDEAIAKIMWAASFDWLIHSSSREEWINRAISIWKSRYSSYDSLSRDSGFKAAFKEWNDTREKDPNKRILNPYVIEEAWKNWKYVENGEDKKEKENEWDKE